jgi:hypothetical protein
MTNDTFQANDEICEYAPHGRKKTQNRKILIAFVAALEISTIVVMYSFIMSLTHPNQIILMISFPKLERIKSSELPWISLCTALKIQFMCSQK